MPPALLPERMAAARSDACAARATAAAATRCALEDRPTARDASLDASATRRAIADCATGGGAGVLCGVSSDIGEGERRSSGECAMCWCCAVAAV